MKKFQKQNDRDYKDFIRDIVQAKKTNSLICFVGAGTSISQGFPNWNEYVDGMIDYWSYHLEDIVSNPKTIFSKVKASDRKFLQWLKKANYSKERKVDLVHEIISEYSQCSNSRDSLSIEKKYIHQYEQTVFLDTEPVLKENKILNELVDLRPIFITTNYDEQIEQACKLSLQLTPTVYSSIDEYHGEELISDDVIHLHGMPKSTEDVFISSSRSYLKMYSEKNRYKEQIKKLFSSVKNPVMIFVGSSLQEDEVLHFFDFKNVDIKKYAIMLFQAEKNELDDTRSEKLKKYYFDRQDIRLIWYENSFSDLPAFLHKLNRDVDIEISQEIIVSEKELKDKVDNKEDPIPSILKALNNQEFMIVDEFLGALEEISIINNLLKNNLFFNKLSKNSNQLLKFWDNVLVNFDNLSLEAQRNALKIVQSDQLFNSRLANLMINITLKYWKKYPTDSKCDFLQSNISRYLGPYIQLDVADETVRCLYLISCLKYNSQYLVTINTNQKFNFNNETYILLSNELQKLDKTGIFYSSWDDIKDRQAISILFDLFIKGNIRYRGRKIFPSSFYNYKVIQKILVNVDLSGGDLTQTVRKKLFSKIDWNFRSIGKEFNEINKKYMLNLSKKSEYFEDGILDIKGGEIVQLPFFEIDVEKDIKTPSNLLKKLSSSVDKPSETNWDNLTEKSLAGQNSELVKKLCSVEYWDKYPSEYIFLITGLFKDAKMYRSFDSTIVKLITYGLEHKLMNIDKIIIKYISFLENHSQFAFTYPNGFDIWKNMIKCPKVEKKTVYKFLFEKVSINNLAFSVPIKEYFDIQDYAQTDFFNYCYVLVAIEELDKKSFDKYMPQLLDKLNKTDVKKREIFKGIFFNYISDKDDEKYSQLSFYFFIEFHNGTSKKIYLAYKNVIELVLKQEVNDSKVINFITASILRYEKPLEKMGTLVTRSSFKSEIYNFILTLYWNNNEDPQYVGQWINLLISKDKSFISQCIGTIVKCIKNEENKEFNFLFNILKSSVSVNNYKLRDQDFILLTFIKDCTISQLRKLIRLIELLCNKGYMHLTSFLESEIDTILSKLSIYNLNSEIDTLLDSLSPFTLHSKLNLWNKKYGS
ncbi:SIR2 family protein [Lactobacillus paragasseri]|uniref:SIR2 family protein n=1 Tax=Lactobacillus TaxID=1578 RepID=UPI001898DBB7|nr:MULTISPECIES: SIR2 family protein [Lactobacillus]MDT9607479.1 SIR2 family protein [Lactobacillus paragasseri]MDT9615232.1 SIR2 family protein [Lactobacillus paragasseri]UFN98098.1 SIR2 family protein [Lactobacillus gasseri]